MSKNRTGDPNKPLSQREKEVVIPYTDPNSPTYLNGTQSIIAAPGYKTSTPMSARSMAAEVMARPHVANAVKEKLEANGMGSDVRLELTSVIAHGYNEEITTTTRTNKDGSTTSTVHKPVAAKTRLDAMKRLDRLDGSEDERKIEAHIMSDGMRTLSRSLLKDVLAPIAPPPDTETASSTSPSLPASEHSTEPPLDAEYTLVPDETDSQGVHKRTHSGDAGTGDGLGGDDPTPSASIPSPPSSLSTKKTSPPSEALF